MISSGDGDDLMTSNSVDVTKLHSASCIVPLVPDQFDDQAVGVTPRDVALLKSEDKLDVMVETLENLILEAYNNMQIDGEHIILPDEVAVKLHRAAEQIQDSCEMEQVDRTSNADEASCSESAFVGHADVEKGKPQLTTLIPDRPEPEKEQTVETLHEPVQRPEELDVSEMQSSKEGEVKLRNKQILLAEVAKLREEKHNRQISRVATSTFTTLTPVPEVDEDTSVEPPSPSPQHLCSHSSANTPKSRYRGQERITPSPNSVAEKSNQIETFSASKTLDQTYISESQSKIYTYEKRRNAAIKLKEDKKLRELRIRESARKQREMSKLQLEEAHKREMEEKRERVRRIRAERIQRRTEKATECNRTKQDGQSCL